MTQTDQLWYSFKTEGIKHYNTLEDFEDGSIGFIYRITHKPSKKFYIGKKVLYFNKKRKLTKKELSEQSGPGRKPTHITEQKESDWKKYWGSSKEFTEFVKINGEEEFTREILHVCKSKKELTYYELKYLITNDCLINPLSFNDNLLGKFFKKDLETDS